MGERQQPKPRLPRGMGSDWKALLREAIQVGWVLERRPNGHYRLSRPGHRAITITNSPSDVRALANARASIARAERNAK